MKSMLLVGAHKVDERRSKFRFLSGAVLLGGIEGGLGLGLFICKQIVEAHAGTLEVSSNGEQGTCFTARIPLTARA